MVVAHNSVLHNDLQNKKERAKSGLKLESKGSFDKVLFHVSSRNGCTDNFFF